MGFFNSLIDTPEYQSQKLAAANLNPVGGIPMPAQQAPAQMGIMHSASGFQSYAKGGLSEANKQIEQAQIMKVLKHYFQNLGVDVNKGMEDVKRQISQGLQLIPFESSVMGYKPLDGTVGQVHFFTVGTLKDLADDMQYFYKYLKNQGVKTIYDTLPAPLTTQMLVKLGAKLEQSDNPKYKMKASI